MNDVVTGHHVSTLTVEDNSSEMTAFLERAAARPQAAREVSTLDKLRHPDPPRARSIGTTLGPVSTVADEAPAPDGHGIPLYWYDPADAARLVIYVHGGGWVSGDREMLDPFARQLADTTGSVVAFIEYRLAPEHDYATVVGDVVAGIIHAVMMWSDGECRGPVHLLGDSAGGHLVAAALDRLVAKHQEPVAALASSILVYPALDPTMSSASYRAHADAPTLTARDMQYSWNVVLDGATDFEEVDGSRLLLRVLDEHPMPTMVVTTGRDPLHEEGRTLAETIEQRGGHVHHVDYPNSPHGILWMAGLLPSGRDLLQRIRDFLDGTRPPAASGPGGRHSTISL